MLFFSSTGCLSAKFIILKVLKILTKPDRFFVDDFCWHLARCFLNISSVCNLIKCFLIKSHNGQASRSRRSIIRSNIGEFFDLFVIHLIHKIGLQRLHSQSQVPVITSCHLHEHTITNSPNKTNTDYISELILNFVNNGNDTRLIAPTDCQSSK